MIKLWLSVVCPLWSLLFHLTPNWWWCRAAALKPASAGALFLLKGVSPSYCRQVLAYRASCDCWVFTFSCKFPISLCLEYFFVLLALTGSSLCLLLCFVVVSLVALNESQTHITTHINFSNPHFPSHFSLGKIFLNPAAQTYDGSWIS